MKLSGVLYAAALVLVPLTTVVACVTGTDDNVSIGDDCANGFCPPDSGSFIAPAGEAGSDGETPDAESALMCKGTECPAPYTTCSNGPSFLCGTNLLTDSQNCGACGHSCEGYDTVNMAARCVNGACAFECISVAPRGHDPLIFRDCNGLLDDGCEINVYADTQNCGACGNACPAGSHCFAGKCGCGPGKTDCDGVCVDLNEDDGNCGACGKFCETPADACDPPPPQTAYGCGGGTCGHLKCYSGFADCNFDLNSSCASDGCETDVGHDAANCGGCGVKCGAGQTCISDDNGPHCADTCATAGLTECADGCYDLVSDPLSCGACGNVCPAPGQHQTSSCTKGFCKLDCLPGYDDCNADPSDGCEVDLSIHPANCGACGNACDFAAGQPCIEGKCLMVECEAGTTK